MKIKTVAVNNRKGQIELTTKAGRSYPFPFAQLDPKPSPESRIAEIYVDKELDQEGITYVLESGEEGSVLLDHALAYNKDPTYAANLLLYKLTSKALEHIEQAGLSRREVARRLNTSLSQLYRLLDPTNYKKSAGQMIQLLYVLDVDVDIVTTPRDAA
ncbi:MAG: helix-turn-helix transcriptional regulator [Deltaproteobacteria bacterium]